MNLQSFLHSTSSAIILGATCLLLSGCGNNNSNNNSDSTSESSNTTGDFKQQLLADSIAITLAFNGFSENGAFYDSTPNNLAGDLSAIEPANLYLYDTFINAVGTTKKPSTAVAASYDRLLPASGTTIKTGNTLLNPALAINSSDPSVAIVSSTNPVILSIPAGLPLRPEAPFFPTGTKYTAVLVEAPTVPGATHGAIVSLEVGGKPLQFAAFAHQQDKTFTLRLYDKTSTTDKSDSSKPGSRVLLTAVKTPAIIQSRFVVLTADGLANVNVNVNLESLDRSTLKSFGFSTGKALLKSVTPVFPQLITSDKKPIFNDGDHGVFCLGGTNTFNTVDLKDQTFVYPISAINKNTQINTLNVSADSGFITESGKHITVTTLNGNGTLKLIAVMKGAATADSIAHVKTLNNVNKINVVVGLVDPAFVLPATGMTLLSFDNVLASPLVVATEDAHISGSFYDGESELRGNEIVLKSLTKKAPLSSGSNTIRSLMAHHPRTQGLSSQAMNSLITTLDPMKSAHQTLGASSAALSHHALVLQEGSPCSANHYVVSLADHLTVSTTNALDHTIASINLNSRFGGVNLATSAYGVSTVNQQEVAFGSSITASKSLDLNGAMLIPSVAVGYSMDAFSDKSFSANGININLTNTALNSVFARFMTAFSHNHEGLSTTFAMGFEARNAMFNRGLASTDYDSVSLAGESLNGVYSIVEASFASNSSRLNVTISNFNHAQIQFGLTD